VTAPKDIVASVLARLRNVPAESELSFNDILQAYLIERFLARLSQSPQVNTTRKTAWSWFTFLTIVV